MYFTENPFCKTLFVVLCLQLIILTREQVDHILQIAENQAYSHHFILFKLKVNTGYV